MFSHEPGGARDGGERSRRRARTRVFRPGARAPGTLAFVILLLPWLPAHAQDEPKGPPPAPVVVSVATWQMLAPVTWYPGTVISRNTARLAAEVEGRLEWVAEIGTRVGKGEAVARIDGTLLRQGLAEDKAEVARERARLRYLEAEVKRRDQLRKQGTATQSALEEVIANRGVTRSELAASLARVELTEERLKRTVLRAPFPGIVTERVLQTGEWAESGKAVVRLVDSESLEVQTWVPVQALEFIAAGSELELDANPKTTQGTVRTIVPVGDERSRLYELRVGLEPNGWPVGQTLRVAVPTAAAKEVVAIPRDALVLRRAGTAVYRVTKDGTADRVEVRGIEPGDRVVTRGGERLRPGQPVRVIGQ